MEFLKNLHFCVSLNKKIAHTYIYIKSNSSKNIFSYKIDIKCYITR